MHAGTPEEQKFDASGHRFALVAARFHGDIVDRLIAGAKVALARHQVAPKDISVFRCPGAFEIPQVAARLTATNEFDAILCFGCVIRGETAHFDYVAGETARGVSQLALTAHVPVLFGVLTTENREQALDRAGGKHGNKGSDTALAALEMIALYAELERKV